jgi:hypothetical protein
MSTEKTTAAKIQLLVKELKALNIRSTEIKVREAEIITELDEICNASGAQSPRPKALAIGNRVHIKTKVVKPRDWNKRIEWDQEKAQFGTVTNIGSNVVHVLTDNRVVTWRRPYNVTRLPN